MTAWDWARVALVALVLCAAAYDLATRRIPNLLNLALLLAGLIAIALTGADALSHAAHFAVALAISLALFALGVIGGGDAKLYSAVAAWFPLKLAAFLGLLTTLLGVVLVIAYFGIGLLAGRRPQRDEGSGKSGLPYGVSIAAGAILTAFVGT